MHDPTHGPAHQAGHYIIRVRGHLDHRWATRFDGMALAHRDDGTSVIEGPIPDQAALHGLLRTVRDLGLPLVSLTQLDPRPGTRPGSDTAPGE